MVEFLGHGDQSVDEEGKTYCQVRTEAGLEKTLWPSATFLRWTIAVKIQMRYTTSMEKISIFLLASAPNII